MKREQLKKLIKPIIKECIHEVIIESGVLSSVVAEVAKGMGNVIVESPQTPAIPKPQVNHNQEAIDQQKRRLNEQRKKLSSAIGKNAYANIFEGVDPTPSQTAIDSPSSASALSGVPSNDPGVDISAIMAVGGKHWKTLATTKKR
tara:strand:- start:454 stop:888 length:435 start_codon:yes stop_codon:yes gene_type:complete